MQHAPESQTNIEVDLTGSSTSAPSRTTQRWSVAVAISRRYARALVTCRAPSRFHGSDAFIVGWDTLHRRRRRPAAAPGR